MISRMTDKVIKQLKLSSYEIRYIPVYVLNNSDDYDKSDFFSSFGKKKDEKFGLKDFYREKNKEPVITRGQKFDEIVSTISTGKFLNLFYTMDAIYYPKLIQYLI